MRTRNFIFSLVGIFVASFIILGLLRLASPSSRLRHMPNGAGGLWLFVFFYVVLELVLIGGGSIANLSRGRLSRWPTTAVIVGYFLTCWLIPLAIWGIILLGLNRKTRNHRSSRN